MRFVPRMARLALSLSLLSLGLFMGSVASASAASTTLYVDTGSNYWLFGKQPRTYDYSSGSAPKSGWGTSSKPFTNIRSAIEAAGYNGFDKVIIKFCDSDPTWYTGGYSSFYDVITDEIEFKDMIVEIKPMGSGCSSSKITRGSIDVPSNAGVAKVIFNGLTFNDSAGSFANMVNIDSNDIDIEIKNNTFESTSVFASNSTGYYDAGTVFTVTNNTATGRTPSGASTTPAWIALTSIGGTITFDGNTCSVGRCVYSDGSDIDSFTNNTFSGTMTSGGSLYVKNADVDLISGNQFSASGGATLINGNFPSITDNTFSAPSSSAGGLYMSSASSDLIYANSFSNYAQAVFMGDTSVLDFRSNSFSTTSTGWSMGQIILSGTSGGGSTISDFSENTFSGPGLSVDTAGIFLGIESIVELMSDNIYSNFRVGVHVADQAQIETLQNDQFSDMGYAIVNDGSFSWIGTIDSIDVFSSDTGIFNSARIGSILNSNFEYTDLGVHFADGGTGALIQANLFLEFDKGILLESDTDEFDALEAGHSDYSEVYSSVGGALDIIENTFTQQEPNVEAIAIATSSASVGQVQTNTLENTGRFLSSYDSDMAHVTNNSALPGTGSFYSPYPAVYLERALSAFPIESNAFYMPGGISPTAMFAYTVQTKDSPLNMIANTMISGENDVLVELTDPSKMFSTTLSSNNFLGTPEAVLIHENNANAHTVRLENNDFFGHSSAVQIDGSATTNGVLELISNRFSTMATGVVVTSPNLKATVDSNTFDAMAGGVIFEGVGTIEAIHGNEFNAVDAPLSILSGSSATTTVHEISSNILLSADTGILLDGVLFTYPSSYDGNVFNNVIANNTTALRITDSATTENYFGIQNNSFDSNDFDLVIAGFDSSDIWAARNNIFSTLGGTSFPILTDDFASAHLDNNLYRTPSASTGTLATLYTGSGDLVTDTAGWSSYTIETLEVAYPSVISNLILEWVGDSYLNAASGDYRPNYASFGLDRAYNTPTTDLMGNLRTQGAGADLGAYESTVSTDGDADWLWTESETAWGSSDADEDSDGDGLVDGDETVTYNTSPVDADSDDDGVSDFVELWEDFTDPLDPLDYVVSSDTDGDGLTDDVDACPTEDASGYDADADGCLDDTDADGVTDDVDACPTEDASGYDADANGCIDDTDGDGVTDDVDACPTEDASGYDADANGCIDDTDGDGLDDAWETLYGFNPYVTDDSAGDPDADGLTNLQEYTYGTHPRNLDATTYHDTDGDGSFGVSYGSGSNVALGASVTSGVYEDPSYSDPASNLVDDDLSTRAYPAAYSFDYTTDLGSAYSLESVRLYWDVFGYYSYYIDSWELNAILSDGTVVLLANGSSSPAAYQSLVQLSSAAASLPIESLQISASSSSNWIGIMELEAYQN